MVTKRVVLMGRYERENLLGQGSFGKVFYARNLKNGQEVAIKVLKKSRIIETHFEKQVMREITAMRLIDHPNIVKLYEVMASETKIYLVLEYVGGGELFDQVVEGRIPMHTARKYFQQLINAVDYCHSRGIYHRDLKPDNLLIDKEGNLKVADFGWSAIVELNRRDVLLKTICGTKSYYSPEVIKKQNYDGAKSDIWSCGVILYVLLTGYHPFQDNNVQKMFAKIQTSTYKEPYKLKFQVGKLIRGMLDPSADSRLSIAQIKEHKWFMEGLVDDNSDQRLETKEQVFMDAYQPLRLNAFDIISQSASLNLTSIINGNEQKREALFISEKPVPEIMSKLRDLANILKLKVLMEAGVIRMKALKEGNKGVLTIKARVFEISPSVHLVEISQAHGDTLEYQELLEKSIRPALDGILSARLYDRHSLVFAHTLSAIRGVCQSFASCMSGFLQSKQTEKLEPCSYTTT